MGSVIELEVANLHERHGRALLRYAVSLARREDVASDAVQEAFLRYFVERRYGRVIQNPPAWLFHVVRNYVRDRLKAFPVHLEVEPEVLDRLPATQRNPEEAARDSETARQLAATLTDRELECFSLRAEGLSYDEIGVVMEIRPGTVGAVLSRVHQKLAKATGPPPKKSILEIARALPYVVRGKWAYTSS